MSSVLIKNAILVLPERTVTDQDVLCKEGTIVNIAPFTKLQPPATTEIVDAAGAYLVPGFIDLHFHGLLEYIVDNGTDDLANICSQLPQFGVTSFLPTLCPLPKGKDAEFLTSLVKVKSQGTQILGFHLEGPFLTLTGALSAEALGKADIDRVNNLINAAKPYKAIFSIAPDFEGIDELIPIMTRNDSPVFITHTMADVKQTQRAIELGACHATHFYDVFPCPEVSDPGVRPCGAVEAILAEQNVSVDFILDGEHVDPVPVKMALECKGSDKVCLITDSNIGAANKPGRYKFNGREVEFTYPGGPARLTEDDKDAGGLAGSGLTMDLAVRNAVKMLDADIPLAVRMASTNPAKVLRLENTKGQIKPGFDADMVLLDEKLQVIQTFISGKCCYKK